MINGPSEAGAVYRITTRIVRDLTGVLFAHSFSACCALIANSRPARLTG